MSESAFLVLVLATALTAGLSAVVGMAGGITLLSVMLLYLDPLIVIPIHGVVQLASNGSRTWIQREHVHWSLVGRYAVLALPAGLIGFRFAKTIPPQALKAFIGFFVLGVTWRPRWISIGSRPRNPNPKRRFVILGGVTGFLNMLIGATGPIIAPFFLDLGLDRRALVGTKAACQAVGHLAKVSVFAAAGFSFLHWAPLLGALIGAAFIGSFLGSRLLDHVNEVWFVRLYKGVLTLLALRLILAFVMDLAAPATSAG
ncbi:MAG: sulfite exporter TauE/SafE family protein [Myxococcota bacterium]|nr:sulfite exporter TauE/SafE family protein [Myxococcota bacterium]